MFAPVLIQSLLIAAAAPAPAAVHAADPNEAARRAQMGRLQDPEDWRRNRLPSEREAQRSASTRFRPTSSGPAIEPPRGALTQPAGSIADESRYRGDKPD